MRRDVFRNMVVPHNHHRLLHLGPPHFELETGGCGESVTHIADPVIDALVEKAKAVRLNYPHVNEGDIGPFIFGRQAEVVQSQIDDATRRVSLGVDTGGDALMTALRSLQDGAIEVEDIALRQPTLDEVFLILTGQPAKSNAA